MPFSRPDAEPEAVISALGDPSRPLTLADARGALDRAASFRHTDPSVGHRISSALVDAAATATVAIQAVAWCSFAESSNATGRIKDALDAFGRATSLAADAKDDELLGRVLVGRVHVLALAGRADESARLAARAESLLRRTGHLPLLAKLYMNRGNAFYQQDRYREAHDTYARAERVFESAGIEDATRVGLLMNQAVAATNLERFDQARALFMRAESLSASLGVAHLEAFARFNRAFLERVGGDYRGALRLLEEAERTFEAQGSRDMVAAAARARAEIYLELGMPSRALELARASAESFAHEAMELDARLARADEARALLAAGEGAEAVPLLEELGTWFRGQKNRAREGLALADIAAAQESQGNLRAAIASGRAAVRILERLELTQAASGARCRLASALLAAGRKAEAERTLAPALAEARSFTSRARLELWTAAGAVAAARGDLREAKRRYRRAAALIENERRFIPGVELRSHTFERFGGVYRELVRLELYERRPRFEAVALFAGRARARSFGDRLARPRHAARGSAGRGGLDARRVLLGALTRRLEEAEAGEDGAPDAAKIAALRRRVIALEHEITQGFRRLDERDSGAGRSRADGNGARDAVLAPDELLLEYLVLGDDVLAVAEGRCRRLMRILPDPTAAIRAAEGRVRFQLEAMLLHAGREGGNLAFARRATDDALRRLHDMLVAPMLEYFPDKRRLIVVPDGFLHRVPFQCLHDGTEYLNARWVVSRLPATELLTRRAHARRRRAGRASTGGVLVAGTVRGGPAFVSRELDAVAAHFDRAETTVLRDASAPVILEALERARVAHLSSHGYFRDDNPVFSRLSTADGALFVADLLERRLSSELVVLSACQTGRVFTGGGDDLSGVAHAFLAAGARRLVASLWRVHDAATHDLMEAFYRHHAAAEAAGRPDPAAALRAAERETREHWDHPFYWGSFSLHGA